MRDMIKRTVDIVEREHWHKTIEGRFIHLVEEVGELANAIGGREGYRSPKRVHSDIEDSLCDVLWHLIVIAHHYEVDFPKAYMAMVDRLEERIRRGEL